MFDQTYEISDLTATTGKGFEDYLNKYAWSMAYFKGHLYVGTWSITTLGVPSLINGGAEIWRLEDEDSARWVKVLDMGEGPIDDRMNMGFREMKEYNGKLYVGSFNIVQKESSLWESEDGFTWAKLKTFESDSIRAMAVYDNKLFFSTTSEFGYSGSGAELWYFDGKDFVKVYSNKKAGGFAAIYVFKGNLYFAEWSDTNPLTMTPLAPLPPQRLFKYDGEKVEPVLELYDGHWMITLEEFGGYLYIGTNGFFGGGVPQSFNLRRSAAPDDPHSWETIVGEGGIYPAGFGYRDNYYAWSLEEYNGKLYLGTLTLLGPSQLWVSDDGIRWSLIFEPDSPMQYGIRELIATDEALYIGSAYNILSPQMRNAGLQVFKLVSYDMGGEHTNLTLDENGIQYGIGYAGDIEKAIAQVEELQKSDIASNQILQNILIQITGRFGESEPILQIVFTSLLWRGMIPTIINTTESAIYNVISPLVERTTGEAPINIDGYALQDLIDKNHDIQLIDVRTPAEREQIYIPGSVHIPFEDVNAVLESGEINKDKPLVFICQSGFRGYMAALLAITYEYHGVYNLEGGTIGGWMELGLPDNIAPIVLKHLR